MENRPGLKREKGKKKERMEEGPIGEGEKKPFDWGFLRFFF